MRKTSPTGATERRSGSSRFKSIFHQNKWDKETLRRTTTANHPSRKHHGNEISVWWNDFNLAAPGFCASGAKRNGSIRFTFSALVSMKPVWSVDRTRKRGVGKDGVPSYGLAEVWRLTFFYHAWVAANETAPPCDIRPYPSWRPSITDRRCSCVSRPEGNFPSVTWKHRHGCCQSEPDKLAQLAQVFCERSRLHGRRSRCWF